MADSPPPPPRPPGPPPAKPPGPPPAKPPGPPPAKPPGPPPIAASNDNSNINININTSSADRSADSRASRDISYDSSYGDEESVSGNPFADSNSSTRDSTSTSNPFHESPKKAPKKKKVVTAPPPAAPKSEVDGNSNSDSNSSSLEMSSNSNSTAAKPPPSSTRAAAGSKKHAPPPAPPPAPPGRGPPSSPPPLSSAGGSTSSNSNGSGFEEVTLPSSRDSHAGGGGDGKSGSGDDGAAVTTANAADVTASLPANTYVEEDEQDAEGEEGLPRNKENMPNPKGFCDVARAMTDVPSDVLGRVLLRHETVVGQFDVMYPTPEWSRSTKLLASLLTCGLYLVYWALCWLGSLLRHVLCTCKWCEDDVYVRRGKAVVTSMGRLIFWELKGKQSRMIDQRAYYAVNTKTSIFNVEDIAQMSLSYSSHMLLFGCCLLDYEVGIDISFYAFDHSCAPKSRYLTTHHPGNFLRDLATYIVGSKQDGASFSSTMFGYKNKQAVTLRLLSNPHDAIFDGEFGREPMEDLIKFQTHVCSLLYNREAPLQTNIYTNNAGAANHHRANNGQVPPPPNKHVFLSMREAADVEVQKTFGETKPQGVNTAHRDMANFELVEEDGTVNVPLYWLPLARDEEIVAAVGQYYRANCFQIALSILTLGLSYVRFLRPKLMERSAIILTTHRVVEIVLHQRHGKMLPEMNNVAMSVRSYYPRKVSSGYIRCDNGFVLQSSLTCVHGQMIIELPSTQLPFAQKMQLVTSREGPLSVEQIENMLPDLSPVREEAARQNGALAIERHLNDLSGRTAAATRAALLQQAQEEEAAGGQSGARSSRRTGKLHDEEHALSALDKILLPLFPNEQLLHRFQGGLHFQPCCLLSVGLFSRFLCSFSNSNPNDPDCCFISPVCLSKCVTCLARPLLSSASCIVTTHSLFYISTTNYEVGGTSAQTIGNTESTCLYGDLYRVDPFLITWVPVRQIRDHSVATESIGGRPFGPFMCCTLAPTNQTSKYQLDISTAEGITYTFAEDRPFHSHPKDAKLAAMQNVLGSIQAALADEQV